MQDKYDDVTYWFVFRCVSNADVWTAEIVGLIPALLSDQLISHYQNRGYVLVDIVASLNKATPNAKPEHKIGNA